MRVLASGLGVLVMSGPTRSRERELTLEQVRGSMKQAEERGLVRRARETKPVDARPAKPGEVVHGRS